MSEHDEQYKLFSWTRYRPELRWMFAIPNGGYRTKATAGKMAAEYPRILEAKIEGKPSVAIQRIK